MGEVGKGKNTYPEILSDDDAGDTRKYYAIIATRQEQTCHVFVGVKARAVIMRTRHSILHCL